MIIKSFVALGFVVKIDDMFSENFPKEIKNMASELTLQLGKDTNSMARIWKLIKKRRAAKKKVNWKGVVFNVLINLWYTAINNFYVIVYYYFFPMIGIVLQFFMFYNKTHN